MNSNTPIYYTNITVEIVKNKTVIETVLIPKVVVKGFTTAHIIQHNIKHILKKLANYYKFGEKQLARVSNIKYLKQLGFGIDFD